MPPKLSYLPDFEGRTALYRRLDPIKSEFRFLTLWPNNDYSSPLECSIQIRSIFDSTDLYDALSYYWGSVNSLEDVIVHGSDEGAPMPSCAVPVTKSLTSALREFRRRATAADQPLEIWTDALCINQRDAQERDRQLRAMELVFQMCRRIRVWLGDCDSSKAAEAGLPSLIKLSEHFQIHAFDGIHLPDQGVKSILDQPSETSELVASIIALMELPYWRRGWAIRESCAITPIFFHFGDQVCELLGWHLFYDTLKRIYYDAHEFGLDITDFEYNFSTLIQPFLQARTLRRQEFDDLRWNSLQRLHCDDFFHSVLDFKMWQTTDPRDYVFVLPGFHKMFQELRTGYNDTVEDVYSDATVVLLRNGTWSHARWRYPYHLPYLPS